MKLISVLVIAALLSGCDVEKQQQKLVNDDYQKLENVIVQADKDNENYITISSQWKICITTLVSRVALKDGWKPVGGVIPDNEYMFFTQTLQKVDASVSLYRDDSGVLALQHNAATN